MFTLELPAGWSATTNSTNPKAINMASLEGPTGTITVLCLTGLGAARVSIEGAMRGSLESSLPNITLVNKNEIKAANGKKALIRVYKGRTEAQGETVALDGLSASVKHRKCWMGFIGVSPESPGGQRVGEMLEIVQSVH